MKRQLWICDQCKVQTVTVNDVIPMQWFEVRLWDRIFQFCSLICLMKWGTKEHQKMEKETKEQADPPITSGCILTWRQN